MFRYALIRKYVLYIHSGHHWNTVICPIISNPHYPTSCRLPSSFPENQLLSGYTNGKKKSSLKKRSGSYVSKESKNVKKKKKWLSFPTTRVPVCIQSSPSFLPCHCCHPKLLQHSTGIPRGAKQNIVRKGSWNAGLGWVGHNLNGWNKIFFTELVKGWLEGSRENVIFRKLQLGNKTAYKRAAMQHWTLGAYK